MQILLEMLNETDVLPEQQIGLVQAQALKLYAFPPDPNRIPKWTWQGEEHFPHSCLLPHKKRKYGHFSQPRFCRPSFRGCTQKAFPRPRQPLFAVPALRELESACRLGILWDAVTVPTVCFSWGSPGGRRGGSTAVCDPNPPRPFARPRP